MQRIIFHVDMDSFFASCEIKKDPTLKDKPVIIGADPKGGTGRGVVSTASYKAREFGVGSGMSISKAYNLCPEGIFIRPDMQYYKALSRQIMMILSGYADNFDPVGIDEAYLDVTDKVRRYGSPRILAAYIKKDIYNQTRLTCSIGIAHNKSIAKIASDIEKPNGMTFIPEGHVKEFLKDLPVKKISGVGKRTNDILKENGIHTIGQLADYDKEKLVRKIGNYALRLWIIANGLESDEVVAREDSDSISTETTFKEDTDDVDFLIDVLKKLNLRVERELKETRYSAKTISIKYRYDDFETHTRARTLSFHFNDIETINNETIRLFKDNYDTDRKIRLIGTKCSNLKIITEKQSRLTDFF